MSNQSPLIIITGNIQSGKTTLTETLVGQLKKQNLKIAGIIARGLWQDNQRSGFDLVDLHTSQVTPLARRDPAPAENAVTGFTFLPQGLEAGQQALSIDHCRSADWVVVDEIGKLELNGQGWAPLLAPLLNLTRTGNIWIVRQSLVEPVCRKWELNPSAIINADDTNAMSTLLQIILS